MNGDVDVDQDSTNSFLVYQGWAGSVISLSYGKFILFSLALWAVIGILILIMRTSGFSFEESMAFFLILLIVYLLWFIEGRRNARGP